MNTMQRIARNTGFLFGGDLTVLLLSTLQVVLLARFLGVAEYGRYSFAGAFTALFLVLADLGFSTLAIREMARDTSRAEQYASTISLTKLVLSLLTFGLIALSINLLNYPAETVLVVYVVGLTGIFGSFAGFFRSIFRAFEKMEYDSLTRIVERLLVVGVAVVFLIRGRNLVEVVEGMLAAQALGLIITLVVCLRKFIHFHFSFDVALARHLFLAALPIAAAGIFSNIIFQTDTVILSAMKGDTVVGWYNAALKPIYAMLFVPGVYLGAILPVTARYFVTSRENLNIAYEKSLKFLAILALPLAVGVTLTARRLVLFLYGQEYLGSVIVLQILTWAVAAVYLSTFLHNMLISIEKQMVSMAVAALAALLNVVLNLLLIPWIGYPGAAVASVVANALVLGLALAYLQRRLHRLNLLTMMVKPALAALVMGGVVYILDWLLSGSVLNLFAIIVVAVAIYVLLLYLLKVFDTEEKRLLRSALSYRLRQIDSDQSV